MNHWLFNFFEPLEHLLTARLQPIYICWNLTSSICKILIKLVVNSKEVSKVFEVVFCDLHVVITQLEMKTCLKLKYILQYGTKSLKLCGSVTKLFIWNMGTFLCILYCKKGFFSRIAVKGNVGLVFQDFTKFIWFPTPALK